MSVVDTTTPTAVPTATWQIDPVHSSIGFAVRHLGVSTYRGSFAGASGTIATSAGGLSEVAGEVELANVVTSDANLTGHLQSPDFFDAARHPRATFRSTSIDQAGDDLTIDGELTLRGVTRAIVLRGELVSVATDPYGNEKIGVEVSGAIDRSAFGITWNVPLANGALTLAESVKLTLAVQAVREA